LTQIFRSFTIIVLTDKDFKLMKKIIYGSLIATLLFTGAVALADESGAEVNAEVKLEASTSRSFPVRLFQSVVNQIKSVRQESKTENKDERKDVKGEVKTAREDMKENIKDIRMNFASSTMAKKLELKLDVARRIATNRYNVIVKRYGAALQREAAIMDRINSRIGKVKTAGGDTSVAEGFVAEAKTHYDAAAVALQTFSTDMAFATSTQASSTSVSKQEVSKLKKDSQVVELHLKEGHASLVKAIAALFKLKIGLEATTSAEVKEDNQ
jgi:gas vesicle protein